MDFADAQIEIATLANLERQAERTAAALERVRDLLREVAEMEERGLRTSVFGLKKIPKSEVRSQKSNKPKKEQA